VKKRDLIPSSGGSCIFDSMPRADTFPGAKHSEPYTDHSSSSVIKHTDFLEVCLHTSYVYFTSCTATTFR
jgi:hypothetical protein